MRGGILLFLFSYFPYNVPSFNSVGGFLVYVRFNVKLKLFGLTLVYGVCLWRGIGLRFIGRV